MLSRDEIWGVRKASVESLAEVAGVMPLEVRSTKLATLLHEFHGDISRWVRISACQALGPFICTLPSEAVGSDLVSLFTQLANPSTTSAVDSDVAFHCAFNFPGVALAVGGARWAELSPAFATLSTNIQWKVRKTLSCSLHEVAAILGPAAAEAELLATLDLFLKDLDEVKVGVLQNLAALLAALPPRSRQLYLPALTELRAETDNWRFRQLLSSQLAAFGSCFSRAATLRTLVPLALDLCTDPVAEVRLAAAAQVGRLINLLADPSCAPASHTEPPPPPPPPPPAAADEGAGEEGAEASGPDGAAEPSAGASEADLTPEATAEAVLGLIDSVVSMLDLPSCHKRAHGIAIVASLVRELPPHIVRERLLPPLVPLATDRIAVVRLPLAHLVKQHLLRLPQGGGGPYAQLPETAAMAEALRADSDRDVLRAVHPDGYEPPRYTCRPDPVVPGSLLGGATLSADELGWGAAADAGPLGDESIGADPFADAEEGDGLQLPDDLLAAGGAAAAEAGGDADAEGDGAGVGAATLQIGQLSLGGATGADGGADGGGVGVGVGDGYE